MLYPVELRGQAVLTKVSGYPDTVYTSTWHVFYCSAPRSRKMRIVSAQKVRGILDLSFAIEVKAEAFSNGEDRI
jgi:hypothetical protein